MRPFEYERPATIEQAIAIKEVVGEERPISVAAPISSI